VRPDYSQGRLQQVNPSAEYFTYTLNGMSAFAVWWAYGMAVEQLILTGPENGRDISRATLVSLADKIDES
jgi:hypothetical protein